MKIRNGFVTNSSSSSFIVNIKNDIPNDCNAYIKKITKDTVKEYFINSFYIDEDDNLYGKTPEELKDLLNIDDEALFILKLINAAVYILDDYLTLVEYFKNNPNAILYEVSYDWGYEPVELCSLFSKEDILVYLN